MYNPIEARKQKRIRIQINQRRKELKSKKAKKRQREKLSTVSDMNPGGYTRNIKLQVIDN